MVKDFRFISLIGSSYKLVAKILANRLVVVLGDIVSEVQSAFVADRQILDGPFILNELLQWCKSKKKQSLIFKVDFEKAYDSVHWDYLDDILKKFGFGENGVGGFKAILDLQGVRLFSTLWARTIKAIHDGEGKIGKKVKATYSSIWLDIVHELEDNWRGDVTFKTLYPRLYALETIKEVTVASKLSYSSLDYSFRRAPRSGVEQSQILSMLAKVKGVALVNMKDR
nr:cysteine-rich receptor-like protein kinase [Tanacetum cinerariifolium]